ncbi:winged helix DNA-binding domain-containing protein [Chitinophaga sp. XS-30]|uniref:winged helix DNA-binding domain-containing protein n=1 Tax=Chitinophaga sp. XS-30 TaxID=2604421 RepID=UPI0011DD8447|nr:winged helix DNA-binding domain-containing protein [Chitinophaga sp. XS-30]QEH43055.1 winged helix DNA-binding domain-containing protein [Chitinophaga sp. XS-30]
MKPRDILLHRLYHQQIAATRFTKPEEIVSWLIAMQSQEYAQAKWAIGLRIPGLKDADVENAFNQGRILRTHLMRPTWHFVSPGDIRWLLQLTAPRVQQINAYYYRQTELDAGIFRKAHTIISKTLEGGRFATRSVLQEALQKGKIKAEGVRLSGIMMHAELEGLICSGPRSGKQFTYALLEERVPPVKQLAAEEALAGFASRYFTSRGPATVQDFAYWSGLTVKDAQEGAMQLPANFIRENINGRDYIYLPIDPDKKLKNANFIMPDYDEYGMSYKDREALMPAENANSVFDHCFVLDGRIAGSWKKAPGNGITVTPFTVLSEARQKALEKAVQRYLAFQGGI